MKGYQCEKIIKEIMEGNDNAIGRLYELIGRNMYAVAYNVLYDYQLAEDAIQESLINVLRGAKALNTPRAAYSWVLTIVRNTSLDILRKRKHESPTEDTELINLSESSMHVTGEAVDVQQALAGLEENDRQIVLLKATMGFSHREIAKMLDLTEGACQKRYQRALKELREHLK